jgi:hypothetical protein
MISLGADVGDIDFDCAVVWERSKMKAAKMALDGLGAAWSQSGRGWLRIRLTPDAELFYAPGTGSLRFSKGRIFSSVSAGLPTMAMPAPTNGKLIPSCRVIFVSHMFVYSLKRGTL